MAESRRKHESSRLSVFLQDVPEDESTDAVEEEKKKIVFSGKVLLL